MTDATKSIYLPPRGKGYRIGGKTGAGAVTHSGAIYLNEMGALLLLEVGQVSNYLVGGFAPGTWSWFETYDLKEEGKA